MTKERYKEIRGNKDFIYLYFREETGSNIDPANFWRLLGLWLNMKMINEIQRIAIIAKYLDQVNKY